MFDGRFVFGSFQASCPEPIRLNGQKGMERHLPCFNNGGTALILIMPSIVDTAVFATSDTLLGSGAVDPDSLGGRLLFVGGMVAPWVDLAFASNAFWRDTNDHSRFAARISASRWSVAVLSNAVLAVGI